MKSFFAVCLLIGVCIVHTSNAAPVDNDQEPVVEEVIVPKHDEPLGKNKCTWGPSYFCSTPERAKECGTEAYCKNRRRSKRSAEDESPPPSEEGPAPESEEPQEENKCYWGPAYFCSSPKHMEECDTVEYCKKMMPQDSEEPGEDESKGAPSELWGLKQAERPEDPEECQKGPEYFCSSPELIEKCKVKNICDNPDRPKL